MSSTKARMDTKNRLKIKQSEAYEGDSWWSWSVWLDGTPKILNEIDDVEYTLHPTFANPVRTIRNRRTQFKLETGGWGVFPIYARVIKKDGTVRKLRHNLRLHYPDGSLNRD